MRNLGKKTNKHGKERQRQRREGERPANRLLTFENKPMVTRGKVGRGMGEQVMGIMHLA